MKNVRAIPRSKLDRNSHRPSSNFRANGIPIGQPYWSVFMSSPMVLRASAVMLFNHSRTGSRSESRRKNRTEIGLSLDISKVYHNWYEPQGFRLPYEMLWRRITPGLVPGAFRPVDLSAGHCRTSAISSPPTVGARLARDHYASRIARKAGSHRNGWNGSKAEVDLTPEAAPRAASLRVTANR